MTRETRDERQLRRIPASPTYSRHTDIATRFGRAKCGRGWCDDVGIGWYPPVWFDAGLHIRMGDVCGKNAHKRGQKVRKCSQRPLEDALEMMKSFGLRGSVFLASDSADTLSQAAAIGHQYGFNVSYLAFDRDNEDHNALCSGTTADATGLELCRRSRSRDRTLLVEALLDALMLSRSSVLVGSMMSNFPRLALQLRVQVPTNSLRYLALDGREWCTRSSCRMNYTQRFGTA